MRERDRQTEGQTERGRETETERNSKIKFLCYKKAYKNLGC